MKKFSSSISPFLLLIIPFLVALVLVAGNAGSEVIEERIQLNASFISLPDLDLFNVLLW
ncbi:hypothetical protein [Parapedobacter sp. DT-150]|uniref:hypothetical protein n=1 Tax=Parapedobacter sp. DT-150 TaxID=3396162 RepID=UPI003F19AC8A